MSSKVDPQSIEDAYINLETIVKHTPLEPNEYFSDKYHADIYLKREDLQIVRSFKIRGAYNAISQLSKEQLKKGLVTASAGNHAQGVAWSSNYLKVKSAIFMPITTPQQKVEQVKYFGGDYVDIHLIGNTYDESSKEAEIYTRKNGLTFIEPFDDPAVISGQGTIGIEILDDFDFLTNADHKKSSKSLDYLIIPIGGGGLISGIATWVKYKSPNTKIIGVEPQGAPSMKKALDANKPVNLLNIDKFVDGAAVQEVGKRTFEITKSLVDEIVLVPEGKVCTSIIELYNKLAIVAEPAGALSVAALDLIKDQIKNKTVVALISGGNNDLQRMPDIEERSLLYEGLMHYFIINFPQRPGALREFLNEVIGPNDDITRFEYIKKFNREKGPVMIGILSKNKDDYLPLIKNIAQFDPNYVDLDEADSVRRFLL